MDILNNKLSIDNNKSRRRQMTENLLCRVQQPWKPSQKYLTLVVP